MRGHARERRSACSCRPCVRRARRARASCLRLRGRGRGSGIHARLGCRPGRCRAISGSDCSSAIGPLARAAWSFSERVVDPGGPRGSVLRPARGSRGPRHLSAQPLLQAGDLDPRHPRSSRTERACARASSPHRRIGTSRSASRTAAVEEGLQMSVPALEQRAANAEGGFRAESARSSGASVRPRGSPGLRGAPLGRSRATSRRGGGCG